MWHWDVGLWQGTHHHIWQGKKVQKLMHQHNELDGFIHALLVRAEILRIKYFATGQEKFLEEALTWLKAVEDVCDQALNRLTGERQQMALYFRLYCDFIKVRLTFDRGEEGHVEQAAKFLKAADQKAAAFADALWRRANLSRLQGSVTSMSHAEYDLLRGNIDYRRPASKSQKGYFHDGLALD